jgi:hypothetical protein
MMVEGEKDLTAPVPTLPPPPLQNEKQLTSMRRDSVKYSVKLLLVSIKRHTEFNASQI